MLSFGSNFVFLMLISFFFIFFVSWFFYFYSVFFYILAFFLFFFVVFLFFRYKKTKKFLEIVNFLSDVFLEGVSIVWPRKNDVVRLSTSVIVIVIFVSIFLYIIDSVLVRLVGLFLF